MFARRRLLLLISEVNRVTRLINRLTGLAKDVFWEQLVTHTLQFIATSIHALTILATLAMLVVPLPRRRPVDACAGRLVFLGSFVAVISLQLIAALALCTLHPMGTSWKRSAFLRAAPSITPYALLLLQQALFALLDILFHRRYHFFKVFVALARGSIISVRFGHQRATWISYLRASLLLLYV